MLIDTTTEFGQRVERRLQEEWIGWLTTIDSNGIPQPRPIWFLWDGETFLIYSRANGHKIDHIAANPNVSLNLDGDGKGGDIIVFTGEAWRDDDAPPANEVPDYVAKYEDGFERIGMTAVAFAQTYSVAIRIKPHKLRGH